MGLIMSRLDSCEGGDSVFLLFFWIWIGLGLGFGWGLDGYLWMAQFYYVFYIPERARGILGFARMGVDTFWDFFWEVWDWDWERREKWDSWV